MSARPVQFARPRRARPGERAALEALQRRASLSNAGDRAALLAHPEAIELPQWQLQAGLVRVLDGDAAIAGFAVVLAAVDGSCELDGLFVDPRAMGAGVGRALVADAARIARERAATSLDVIANPHAVGFYERAGFSAGEQVLTRFGPARRMRLALADAG